MKNDKLVSAAIIAIIAFAVMAYFARPRAPQLQLVTPQQELPSYQAPYPGDPSLSNRVLKSYELAFILVKSPYLAPNVAALEGIREWARDKFQSQPDFLHPVSLPAPAEKRDTVFGAVGYSTLAMPKYWLQAQIGELLRTQIARFHETSAYRSFNTSFFNMFGKDADAATLLARYESDRAGQAVDVVMWALVWFGASIASIYTLIVRSDRDFFNSLRIVTSAAWWLLTAAYLAQCWSSGHAAELLSAILSGGIAFYLYRPFLVVSHREAKQQLVRIHLAPCWIATACWFTITCLGVQLLTWIHAGIPGAPDPVSLFLCSISGNFLHDPVQGKHMVSDAIAGVWLIVSAWALLQRKKDKPYYAEPDINFRALDAAMTFDHAN